MKTVEFKVRFSKQEEQFIYDCIPYNANLSGTYVLASEAQEALNQANADWVERCRKFRKQDADEAQERERVIVERVADLEHFLYAYLTPEEMKMAIKDRKHERVLVETLDRVTAYYEGCMQGIKTDNYQDVIDQARAALAAKEG